MPTVDHTRHQNDDASHKLAIAGLRGAALLMAVLGFFPFANWIAGGHQFETYHQVASEWLNGSLIVVGCAVVLAILSRRSALWRPALFDGLIQHAHDRPVRTGIVLAIGLGVVYLVVVTTVLGWWKPAIHEPRRVGGGWMWSVPVLLLLGALINLATTKWGEIDHVGAYVGWLALGTVFVGFSEELLTRGLAIVGGRGSMHERWVWAFSSAIFGLIHAPNLLFGQSGVETAKQVVFAFGVGNVRFAFRASASIGKRLSLRSGAAAPSGATAPVCDC